MRRSITICDLCQILR